ncbi:hypothetical protein [Arcobacter sp. s6]|uniref:hypothetical protein n=1 Tax=Arcobacter sp. s6 TaxID=3230363 RepID=UPI0034A04547
MDNMNNINSLSFDTQNILNELQILIPQFNKFFNINDIFSSEIGGKTRLHRQIFNENNESIQESISRLNIQFDDFLSLIRQEMRNILAKYGEYEKSELTDLIFDDKNFIEILELNLDTKGITRDTKQKCLKDIKKLIHLKNKIFNLKYLVYMFDTSIFDKYINKLGVEDLINSTIIFEVIDSYALQFEELMKFDQEIRNIDNMNYKTTNFNNFNLLFELHKRRVDNFTYANVRYKIFIDYDINVDLNKAINLNSIYLENILSCFIEQSCMDLVKKELKRGKIQKHIDIKMSLKKNILEVIVKNNGFEIKNIYNLFLSDIDNKYTLEAKNLANMLNGKLEINAIENEGMQYSLTIKIK